MDLVLFGHPFSSYCQKVTTAFYEAGTPFRMEVVDFGNPQSVVAFGALWPLKRMPVLTDGDRAVMESSIIIEYAATTYPGAWSPIPGEGGAALDVRFMDRAFDNYVMTPMQRIVADFMRPTAERNARTVSEARALLATAYHWLDTRMATRRWACGDAFTLADCAAAPSLFYADWVYPIASECSHLVAYRARLLARPSFKRAVDEARPYRNLFPPGAPDRD